MRLEPVTASLELDHHSSPLVHTNAYKQPDMIHGHLCQCPTSKQHVREITLKVITNISANINVKIFLICLSLQFPTVKRCFESLFQPHIPMISRGPSDFIIDFPIPCERHMQPTEPLSRYRPGGYHPVHLGDVYHNGKFQIIHKLGWGSYATVWLAKDLSQPKPYASVSDTLPQTIISL